MIVLAINNRLALERLKERYLDDVYEQDITFMEGAIEFLSKNRGGNNIIITKDNLARKFI